MEIPLLQDIAVIFGLSVLVLLISHQVRMPTIVGFLLTGIFVGPHGLRLIKAVHNVETLAEIGVVLLLFTIGLEFSFKELSRLKKAVLLGGSLQVVLTVAATFAIVLKLGEVPSKAIFIGFLVALSSTAIVLKIFQEKAEVENPTDRTVETIHTMKREIIYFRKQVWPLREVVGGLVRGEFSLISESTALYLRDVHDHTIQVIDTVESLRDVLGGMLDIYLSTISNRMNEVMKVLTIIATIFIPLTFVAGIYGMNFKYMPELEWHWGYFMVWGIIVATVASMVLYFKKKMWL